jgi:hypothetical protein
MKTRRGKARHSAKEAAGLLRAPQRALPLMRKLVSDAVGLGFAQRHLYSYTKTRCSTESALNASLRWILDAQRSDGGIAAYYSLLSGYSSSYAEVTGYIVPTLYDFAGQCSDRIDSSKAICAAERATDWLLSQQKPSGAFPGGLHPASSRPSIFNTGQILQGLIRAHAETNDPEIYVAAVRAADWLIEMQQPDGSWSGPGAYQGSAHAYYSMVGWPLALLSSKTGDSRYRHAAEKNLDWVLSCFQPNGWVSDINLQGHPDYLHFIAYVLQGALECAWLCQRGDAIDAVANSSWALLRQFEMKKFLCGAYDGNFKDGRRFACLTGNAQMSCVWLRLFEITADLRYLNAALKMNEMLKARICTQGRRGIAGGVSGSYPIWGCYQPLRYISWGCKFFVDALLFEHRMKRSFESSAIEAFACAS